MLAEAGQNLSAIPLGSGRQGASRSSARLSIAGANLMGRSRSNDRRQTARSPPAPARGATDNLELAHLRALAAAGEGPPRQLKKGWCPTIAGARSRGRLRAALGVRSRRPLDERSAGQKDQPAATLYVRRGVCPSRDEDRPGAKAER
jgi:hypothetical protein